MSLDRRCSNPKCDASPTGKAARVRGPFDWCRVCRAIAAVKKGAQRARARMLSECHVTDGDVHPEPCSDAAPVAAMNAR